MRVLVYGAGVLGCELAHVLYQAAHDVTLLARGEWKKSIDENGLRIRHYVQRKTTVDPIKTTELLRKDDRYDLIFVVMQCNQLADILAALGKNCSQRIVFIGNNGDAYQTVKKLHEYSEVEKETAFGFQATCGRREDGKVISVHKGLSLTLGGLDHPLSASFQKQLEELFHSAKVKPVWEHQMDAWLKCHLAFILPICYLCYILDGQLSKASRKQRKLILDAAYEGYEVIKACKIAIRPDNDDAYFDRGIKRRIMELMVLVVCKTPLGRLMASDHAMHAVSEMRLLDEQFDRLCKRSELPMPNCERLKSGMVCWDDLMKGVVR